MTGRFEYPFRIHYAKVDASGYRVFALDLMGHA